MVTMSSFFIVVPSKWSHGQCWFAAEQSASVNEFNPVGSCCMLKKSDQWSFFGNQQLMDTERWDAGGTGLTKHDKLMGVPLVTVLTVWPGEYPSCNKKQDSSLPSPNLCQGRFISWENMIRILPTLKSPIPLNCRASCLVSWSVSSLISGYSMLYPITFRSPPCHWCPQGRWRNFSAPLMVPVFWTIELRVRCEMLG